MGKKKGPLTEFVSFVGQGSQMAPPTFWAQLSDLFAVIPKETFTEKEESAKSVLTGILKGIKAGPEPRSHLTAAWGCYWDVCYLFLELGLGHDEFILRESIFPIYKGYLVGDKSNERYLVSQDNGVAAAVCGSGLVKLDSKGKDIAIKVLGRVWKKVEDFIVDVVKSELNGAGDAVRECAEKWVKLVAGVLKQLPRDGAVYEAVIKSNVAIFAELIETLLLTNGTVSRLLPLSVL
jgi:hypothetical protein